VGCAGSSFFYFLFFKREANRAWDAQVHLLFIFYFLSGRRIGRGMRRFVFFLIYAVLAGTKISEFRYLNT
jgi:hypothetical protein